MNYFVVDYGIQIIKSTPFYAQANGQAEASNKVFIGILKKMLEENLKDWHRILSETLWAYRTSKRRSTGVSIFSDLWTICSTPNGSSGAFSKSFQEK